MITKHQMKSAVETVANALAVKDNKITTLDLKNELRSVYPAIIWNQYTTNGVAGVSDLFHELVYEGKFRSIADNGTYQTYLPVGFTRTARPSVNTLVTAIAKANPGQPRLSNGRFSTTKVKVKVTPVKATVTKKAPKTTTTAKISRTKALDLMKNNKGHFFTVEFIKKEDGSLRKLNGQYVKDQTQSPLGYVLVKEASKLKAPGKNPIRNVNLQTLQTLKIGGILYSVK